jgi:hypothetical protein
LTTIRKHVYLYPNKSGAVPTNPQLTIKHMQALLVRLAIPEEFVETPLGHKLSIIVPPLGGAVGEIFYIEL